MGIDSHGLNFLKYAGLDGPLGKTVMIGRQNLHSSPTQKEIFRRHIGEAAYKPFGGEFGPFAEEFLIAEFGATSVDSVDVSPFEGANILHDMNTPLPKKLAGLYDTVIDFGSSEHVFDVAQAMRNVIDLCKSNGGRILQVLPANNQCGHGFWQFSPEIFWSLYTPENGFKNTSLFISALADQKHWYRVKRPPPGKRLNIVSHDRLYIMVKAEKMEALKTLSVQQSDYVVAWNAAEQVEKQAPFNKKKRSEIKSAGRAVWRFYKRHVLGGVAPSHRLGRNHPHLEYVSIKDVLNRA